VFKHDVFYVFELGMERAQRAISGKDTLAEGFEFRSATLDDVLRDTELAPRERAEYERRFAAGDHCYAVFDGSNCVNLNWIHFGSCYVRGAGLLLELTGRDGYVYGVVTRPSHRGLGLYAAAQARLVNLLVRDRIPRFLQLVSANNMAPLRVLPGLGYERTQAVRSLTAFGGKRTVIQELATMTTIQQHHWRSPSQIFRI
jgi:hypothetical protein